MKSLIKRTISVLLNFSPVRSFFQHGANRINEIKQKDICKQISPGNIVLSGPFKGLKYASLKAAGSALLPKIIGSYEDELRPLFEEIFHRNYERIIDVGCAEGYYAVGLALKIPSATMFAFDTNLNARQLCKEMALINHVSDRVNISGFCGPDELTSIISDVEGLVICDAEGYENTLFSEKVISRLKKCDALIELHDYFNEGKSKEIVKHFENSHETKIIISNFNKYVSDYLAEDIVRKTGLMDTSLVERPIRMCWLYAKSKSIL